MMAFLLPLPRLHRAWRRRLASLMYLMVLMGVRADVAVGSSSAGAASSAAPAVSAPAATFTAGSPQIATVTGAPLANLGTGLNAAQAQAAYAQYTSLKAQVDEARRQALVKASQAPDKISRWKALTDFEQAQKDNLTLLRQLDAQVTNLEVQQQAQAKAARKVGATK
ncbi:MAG TPA: hypothetical protein VHC86_06925 [Opitutaceae bacterium]|nr:hypothetical protein [Opitutaceae bacterium]